MFTRIGTQGTLIDILITGSSDVSQRASAEVISTDRVGVTVRSFLTWVADAGIIQLAQQSCASMRAFTDKRCHTVMTGGAVGTGSTGAVVNVLTAVFSSPTIDADTLETAVGVVTRAAVLASIGHQLAFIHIICAKLTCELWSALAVIGIHPIYTGSSVLALMAGTVVNVNVAVFSRKTWNTGALVAGVSFLDAGPSIEAR